MTALLEVEGLSKRFGGLAAVKDLSFSVPRGRIAGLIGPNGAGKTTAFNVISGVLPATSGHVRFDGSEVTGKRPSAIVMRGLARTFQQTTTYAADTVEENIRNAMLTRLQGSAPQRLMLRNTGLLDSTQAASEVERILQVVRSEEHTSELQSL